MGQERRCTSSFFRVAKKLSATALSKQSPLEGLSDRATGALVFLFLAVGRFAFPIREPGLPVTGYLR